MLISRRADASLQNPHKKRGIFREDIVSITPKPRNSSPILYKPSTTPAPEITNEIVEELPPAEYFQQNQDEKVNSLEQQLLNTQYEALKVPNYIKRDQMSRAKCAKKINRKM